MSDTKIVVGPVRFSFPKVFKPEAMEEGQDPKYSICLLIPKSDTALVAKIKAAIDSCIEENKKMFDGVPKGKLKNPLRDADDETNESKVNDPNYEKVWKGHYFMNVSTKNKPGVLNAKREPIIEPNDFYAGCYGYATINPFAFDQKGNKGIAFGLNNLLKSKDGERIAGFTSAEEDFADLEIPTDDESSDESFL